MTQEHVGAGWCQTSEGGMGSNYIGEYTDSSACWDDCVSIYGSTVVAADYWGDDWGDCYCSHDCLCMHDVGDDSVTLVVKEGTQVPGACDVNYLNSGSCDWPLDEAACEAKAEEFGMNYEAGCWHGDPPGCTIDEGLPDMWFNRHVNNVDCGTYQIECVCNNINTGGTTTPSPTPSEVCKDEHFDGTAVLIVLIILLCCCCTLCVGFLFALKKCQESCFSRPTQPVHPRQAYAQSEEGTAQTGMVASGVVVPGVAVPMTDAQSTVAVKGRVVQQPPPADLSPPANSEEGLVVVQAVIVDS